MQYNDSADVETVNLLLDSSGVPDIFMENASFGIEQVPMTTVIIGVSFERGNWILKCQSAFQDIEFDWLEVIRISTIVYLVIICFWFGSGVFFIFTIRCEVLDTAIFNTTILILVVLFQIAHAGLVTSLIFFQVITAIWKLYR